MQEIITNKGINIWGEKTILLTDMCSKKAKDTKENTLKVE